MLLNENNLCSYYDFDKNPGIKAKGKFVSSKFQFLDDEEITNKLVSFKSEDQINIVFDLPQMHCSSCIYLLENLHKIEKGIISSKANFQKKSVFVIFDPQKISLRKVVELLSFVGYEPSLSLNNLKKKKSKFHNKRRIIEIGVSGFCFSNIMMLSFPEYFSSGNISEESLKLIFNWLIFLLSLPVLFFGSSSILVSAYKGLRSKDLNIDVPIALAIIITFGRSYYEIISGSGSGYLDSGTGIIFYMLIGRWFQDKTYTALSFDRDYLSFFPLGVTVLRNSVESTVAATSLKENDIAIIRNEEMIPADAEIIEGNAFLDYSFVSGENRPVKKLPGELIYAGGKQIGSLIKVRILKQPSQSYITELWNNSAFNENKNSKDSFIHPWSRYFTIVLFSVALLAVTYWYFNDPSLIFKVLTSVLIVACPCSLLLSSTFTFGSMLRHFGKNKLYMKNSGVIESLGKVNTIVFDKTGTITENTNISLKYYGDILSPEEESFVQKVTSQSNHHLSKIVNQSFVREANSVETVESFREYPGRGIEGVFDNNRIKIGSGSFTGNTFKDAEEMGSRVYVQINGSLKGFYEIVNVYREGFTEMIKKLQQENFEIHILSGDNNSEEKRLQDMLGKKVKLNFNILPEEKLNYIKKLQSCRKNVLMVGDGLNDAGALKQSNTGIAVSNNSARFTPACDAIVDGSSVKKIYNFIKYASSGKKLVSAGFILSILYNFVGLSFAVSGHLSPLVAAILMPASSISIVLTATLFSRFIAKKVGL